MKIVTYNINGLKARIASHRSLLAFLNSLEADIICLQETKLSRQELTSDVAIAKGYEAFFSCTRTSKRGRVGYSGVATFCRAERTCASTSCIVPIAADEGFTGLLHCSRTGEIEGGKTRVGCYDEVLNMEGITQQELLRLDSEGRCLVTDHGSFVLFNIYGPCVQCGDTERIQFKLKFFRALQCRWEALLRQRKRVIIVGDLNIAPFRIDSCDPGPQFEANLSRRWLRSLLKDHSFFDVFRFFHPKRKDAYTCWSQASGAEEFNFGTRIDLIIAAGPCMHENSDIVDDADVSSSCHGFVHCEVIDCDILTKFKRFKPDSLPRWIGGRNLKLDGSDHAPVFVVLKEQSPIEPHDVPALAIRFLPKLHGHQQSIVSLFQKRRNGADNNDTSEEKTEGPFTSESFNYADQDINLKLESFEWSLRKKIFESTFDYAEAGNIPSKEAGLDTEDLFKSEDIREQFFHIESKETIAEFRNSTKSSSQDAGQRLNYQNYSPKAVGTLVNKNSSDMNKPTSKRARKKEVQNASQSSLRSFFVPKSEDIRLAVQGPSHPSHYTVSSDLSHEATRELNNAKTRIRSDMKGLHSLCQHVKFQGTDSGANTSMDYLCTLKGNAIFNQNQIGGKEGLAYMESYKQLHQNSHPAAKSHTLSQEKAHLNENTKTAVHEWKRIHELMARNNPVCMGHGEPCVARIVKKAGPNIGRGFYVCARAEGPASNPEARCDHFEWASSKNKKKIS